MKNNHNGGKRLICDGCHAATATYDKAVSDSFVVDQARQAGWSWKIGGRAGRHLCPTCTQKAEAAKEGK
jgi:hypothetical protein